MNLATFRSVISQELGLDNDASTEQPLIDQAVNDAVLEVLRDTRCYVKSEVIAAASLTATGVVSGDYVLPVEFFEVIDLFTTSSGTNYALERLSVQGLVDRRRAVSPAGTPAKFYAVNGANMLMFYPDIGTGDTLTAYYVPVPAALSASGDDPATATLGGIPTSLHKGIFYQACKALASYDDDASSAQGQRYSDWYDAEITKYRKELNRLGGRNARAVVNDKRRVWPYHDNSTYPSGRW